MYILLILLVASVASNVRCMDVAFLFWNLKRLTVVAAPLIAWWWCCTLHNANLSALQCQYAQYIVYSVKQCNRMNTNCERDGEGNLIVYFAKHWMEIKVNHCKNHQRKQSLLEFKSYRYCSCCPILVGTSFSRIFEFKITCVLLVILVMILVCLCSRLYDEHPQEVRGQRPESVWNWSHREERPHPNLCPDHQWHTHRYQWVFISACISYFVSFSLYLFLFLSKPGKSISWSMSQWLAHITTMT